MQATPMELGVAPFVRVTNDKQQSLGGAFMPNLTLEELEDFLFNGDLSEEEDEGDDAHLDGWQIPPHRPDQLKSGATWFRYRWEGPGRLLIRHDKEPGAVYMLPIKDNESTPMPATPLIKPSICYKLDYEGYQKLRVQQKGTQAGAFTRRHGHRGNKRKKKEQEIHENAERRMQKRPGMTELSLHTPVSVPTEMVSPLLNEPLDSSSPSPLLSKAWSKRVIHELEGEDLRLDPFKWYNGTFLANDMADMEAEVINHPPKRAPAEGWFLVPVKSPNSPAWARKSFPNSCHLETVGLAYYVIRSPTVLGKRVIDHIYGLIAHSLDGDDVSHSGIMGYTSNHGRSSYKAKHLGLSCHYGRDANFDFNVEKSSGLRLSRDTMAQTGRNGEADARTDAIKRILFVMQKHLAPEISRYLRYIDPVAYQFAQAVRQRVLAFQGENLKKWALDFGGAFYCVALGKGHSFKIHIDGTDWCKSYAVVVPFGDFNGGDLVLPSCGLAVPIKSGQFVAVTASFLPHFISTTRGLRYAATFFTDQFIACKMRDVLIQMGFSTTDLDFEP